MSHDFPFARAVVRDGTVTLHRWSPHLLTGGPGGMILARVDATLFDLTRLPGDELIAAALTPAEVDADAGDALVRWAAAVGYRRLWLPGAVHELDALARPLDRAHVHCRECGADWDDGTIAFWETVRERGAFPQSCLACGGTLPQWRPSFDSDTPGLP